MSALIDYYNFLFFEKADVRTTDWLFMTTPVNLMMVQGGYLLLVYGILPIYMKNRNAYDLKGVIAGYNVFQVLACVLLIYGVLTSGWTKEHVIGCKSTDFSDNESAISMARVFWWTMMLKFVELIETIFFLLRKKYNQVSPLHVYHHSSTLTIAWLSTKFYPGGMLAFNIALNSFTHILMYSYYFLASLGPEMQKKLESVKPKLTIFQIVQLFALFAHTLQMLMPTCHMHYIVPIIYLPNVAINIYFFAQFYVKSYQKAKDV